MSNRGDLETFAGYRVQDWNPSNPLSDPATTVHRIAVEYDEELSWTVKFQSYLAMPGAELVQALVVGLWFPEGTDEALAAEMIAALSGAGQRLPALRALFVGDINQSESEVSWIAQGDLSPVLAAFPKLTNLGIKGGTNLSLGAVNLPDLRELIIETGGLSAEVVRQVASASLPALEHLELYLGTEDYGATSTPEDLSPFLNAAAFPKLTYLGLKNSDMQDQIAQMFAAAPVLARLKTLDLSMGTLSDEGGAALLGSQQVKALEKLDLSHHFLSDELMNKLTALGDFVDVSDQQEADEDDDQVWRFVAMGE